MRSSAAFLSIALLIGCRGGPAGSDSGKIPLDPIPERMRGLMEKAAMLMPPERWEKIRRDTERYALALQGLMSEDPKDQAEALRVAEELRHVEIYPSRKGAPPPRLTDRGDRRLLEIARGKDPEASKAARRELARRARVFLNCLIFTEPFDIVRWNAAKTELLKLGDDAKISMAFALLAVLMDARRRMDWEYARLFFAELGGIGAEVLEATWDRYLREAIPPDDALLFPHMEKPIQLFMTMIQLIRYTREKFLQIARGQKAWQRRCVAEAIGRSREVTLLPVLQDYTKDARVLVRATAYSALGRMNWARGEAGAALEDALGRETDPFGLMYVVDALVKLEKRDIVPRLIPLLDRSDYELVRAVMQALARLTGERRPKTPAEWKNWWAARGGK